MTDPRKLNLPIVYEELVQSLNEELTKMMQFVVPVETAEQELAIITNSMRYSGKIVFLLGEPGIGKSTFIQSLTWRKFLPIPNIKEINAHELGKRHERFERLYEKLSEIASKAKQDRLGMITIVINYLEDFYGYEEEHVRAFFRDINGLLRNNLILVIWPVTKRDEAQRMLGLASAVSGTVFAEKPILEFSGPLQAKFPAIAKSTIATLNEGLSFDDFQLSDEDFENLLVTLNNRPGSERTIRDYLNLVKVEWENRSDEIQSVIDRIPRFTEIWFVICYPEAENTVNQFARKSADPELAWNADLRKFSEYLTGQKADYWNQKRLIYALQGFFKTKILFIPTNALVSCVAAFGSEKDRKSGVDLQQYVEQPFLDKIHSQLPSQEWRKKWKAVRFLNTVPIVQQLKEDGAILGGRRGKSSLENAKVAFLSINHFVSSGGEGSDQSINKSLAAGLKQTLEDYDLDISAEKPHPWLDKIRPDIVIRKKDKVICIELHYTADARPYVLANYVLTKLDVYMRQLDAYMEKPRLILEA